MANNLENYATIFDPATCASKGLCPVTKIQKAKDESPLESHSLYYEIHGTGPEKLVFVMGLNGSSFGWHNQIKHFARDPRYTSLVFDNRGVGNSDTPKGPYSTSSMAEDAIVLLDYIGWKEPRSLHIIGISLGGMISLELATRIPERIVTLSLTVTTAGTRFFKQLPPWKGASTLARLMTIKDPEQKVPYVVDMLYPQAWLDSTTPEGKTQRELQAEDYLYRTKITRPQQPHGAFSQMAAAMTHYVSPERLASLSPSLYPSSPTAIPHVVILTGDEDHLVHTSNSTHLHKSIPGSQYDVWEGTGHGIPAQWPAKFNKYVEDAVTEGRRRVESAGGK